MYFKTAKDSDTGKKLAAVYEKGVDAWHKREELLGELMEKYPGMTGRFWDKGGNTVWGGISTVEFAEDPKSDFWVNIQNKEYIPLESTEEGEAVAKQIAELPVVNYPEINACINYNNPKDVVGFRVGKDYFGLEIDPAWNHKMPEDCQEITYSEFANL